MDGEVAVGFWQSVLVYGKGILLDFPSQQPFFFYLGKLNSIFMVKYI